MDKFSSAGVVVLTDSEEFLGQEPSSSNSSCPEGFRPCLTHPSCYSVSFHPFLTDAFVSLLFLLTSTKPQVESHCDKQIDCEDGSDESSCQVHLCEDCGDTRITSSLQSRMFPGSMDAIDREVMVTSQLDQAGLPTTWVEEVPVPNLSLKMVGVSNCLLGEEVSLQAVVRGRGRGVLRMSLLPGRGWSEVEGGPVAINVDEDGSWHRVVRFAVRVLLVGNLEVRANVAFGGVVAASVAVVEVAERGFPTTHHSSIQLSLSHNSYSLQTFSVAALGDNTVTLSLAGDRLGPPLAPPSSFTSSPNCEASASLLATLVHHFNLRSSTRRKVDRGWGDQMHNAYQELLSCQDPSGGFSYHFGSDVRSIWVTAVAVDSLARAARDLLPR